MTLPDPRPIPQTNPEERPSLPPPEPRTYRRSWDDVVEDSFPASDPPPTPIRIGSAERDEEEAEKK